MQLKRLEMVGFKSFARNTTFDFGPGVTALVGPNGCGKSNVVDAIKWILGEQSVKSLRGKQMSDVIYNSGAGRKPIGFAEATLTFDNSDGRLSPETDEVSVTRRVYQTGQSEYFINKKSCRLKDVKTMFLDTGIGVECYSVIEQGRIDRILQASATERREVFEEAAGISRYKVRRREAMAKLERTQANLLRVHDIVEEVAKQLRSVKYQAAKARRYRTYSDELRRLRVSYSLNDYHRLQKQLNDWKSQEEQLSRARTSTQTRMVELDAQRSGVETMAVSLETELEQMQRQLGEIEARVSTGEEAVRFETGRADEQAELRGRLERQRLVIAERLEQMSRDLLSRAEQLERAQTLSAEKRQALTNRQTGLTEMIAREEAVVQSLNSRKGEVIGLMQEAAQFTNELSAIGSDLRNVNAQLERLNLRLSGAHAERTSNNDQGRELSEEISGLKTVLEQLTVQRTERRQERDAVRTTLDALTSESDEVGRELGSKRSRLELLEDLDAKQEGLEEGVRVVLESARAGAEELSGVLGMLGENIEVQDGYAHAVEAALGHRVQTLIVRRPDDSRQGLQCVHKVGGRVSFVALSDLHPDGHEEHSSLNGRPGVLGRLRDYVTASGYTEEALNCLLDGFYLVDGFDQALTLRREGTNGHSLVTVSGEVIEPTGLMTGGRGVAGGGLLRRSEERRHLAQELTALSERVVELEERIEERRRSLSETETNLVRLDELYGQTETSHQGKGHVLQRIEENQDRLEEELRIIDSEQRELVAERDRLLTGQAELSERLRQVELRREETGSRIENLSGQQEQSTGRRVELAEEVTELKVALAGSQQMIEGLRAAIESLSTEQQRQQDESERLVDEIELTHLKESQAREAVEARREQLEELRRGQRELNERLTEANSRRQQQRNQLIEIEEVARQLNGELSELERKAQDVQLGLQECRLKMENIVARVHEEYELDLTQLYNDYQPEEMEWDEVAAKIEDLRSKLHNMGSVNLDAIHDEESLQERLEFLTTQKEDLERATRQLEEIIRKINRKCREQFQETFATIRAHFQEMFRKLFGGGKADIFLEDEGDILESGIEIIARPPGKEPRALSLLSGGEKVLTAVALLFAIFKTKPSPFCILDEVDAALDEANIGRFCSIVQDFLDQSQFIIITHCKRTMAMANVLYGITMPEAGVSSKVMVKFEEYEQQVA